MLIINLSGFGLASVWGSAFAMGCCLIVARISTYSCYNHLGRQIEISMKEDAVDPSFFNFFLGVMQKQLFWRLPSFYVVTGCITILQAVPS